MNKKNSIWLVTITLAGLGMIGPFATDTYLPSFQEIEAEFGTPEALVQQTLSIYLITFAVMTLIYGTLSDMVRPQADYHRRPHAVFRSVSFCGLCAQFRMSSDCPRAAGADRGSRYCDRTSRGSGPIRRLYRSAADGQHCDGLLACALRSLRFSAALSRTTWAGVSFSCS